MIAGEAPEDWHGSVSVSVTEVLLVPGKLLSEGIVDLAAITQKFGATGAHLLQSLLASENYNNSLNLGKGIT